MILKLYPLICDFLIGLIQRLKLYISTMVLCCFQGTGYHGHYCDEKLPICYPDNCLNGGTCAADDTNEYGWGCECPTSMFKLLIAI